MTEMALGFFEHLAGQADIVPDLPR